MKNLFYNSKSVKISPPTSINFTSEFDKVLYELFYDRIVSGSQYRPILSCEDFSTLGITIDLLALYEKSELKIPEPSTKATNRDRLWLQFLMRDFLSRFPIFMGLVYNNITQADIAISNAEILYEQKVSGSNFINIKSVIDEINRSAWTRERDQSERQSGVSTLGSISEKLLQIVFTELVDDSSFFKVSRSEVQTYGDFVLVCLPNNLWISVKSNFARERLLASGFTNDILGVGFFEDASEFTGSVRIRNFQRAGFLAMYCPDVSVSEEQVLEDTSTYKQVSQYYEENNLPMPVNINGKPFIRKLSDLYSDLQILLSQTDVRKRLTVRF